MSLHRRNPRRDANEPEIIEALEARGAEVTQISGRGAPDLLVRFRRGLWAFEVKTEKGKRTKEQEKSKWPIVRSAAEAVKAIGVRER